MYRISYSYNPSRSRELASAQGFHKVKCLQKDIKLPLNVSGTLAKSHPQTPRSPRPAAKSAGMVASVTPGRGGRTPLTIEQPRGQGTGRGWWKMWDPLFPRKLASSRRKWGVGEHYTCPASAAPFHSSHDAAFYELTHNCLVWFRKRALCSLTVLSAATCLSLRKHSIN